MGFNDGDIGRGERIRTSGLHVPNVALYQAKLHPEGLQCNKAGWFDQPENSRFFAALVGVDRSLLHFFDVQQALRSHAGGIDFFAGIRVGLYLGHAQHFFVRAGHGVTKPGGFLLSCGTHGLVVTVSQCVTVLRLGKCPNG